MVMRVYKSTDAGAPQIANANSSLIAILRACLVGTAGVAYGSVPSAGWSEPYAAASNGASFRQGAGGNNRYIRVVDNGNQPDATYRRVNVRGYENMTAVATGTNPFPTTGQVSGNGPNFSYRSTTVTAPDVPLWELYATSSFFHLLIDTLPGQAYYSYMAFGTFFSDKPGDVFNDVLIASADNAQGGWKGYYDNGPTSNTGVYVCRSDTGVAGARYGGIHALNPSAGGFGRGDAGVYPYPDRVRTGLLQRQAFLRCENYFRGRIPGLWEVAHHASDIGGDKTTWQGAPGSPLAGKSFKLNGWLDPQYVGIAAVVIETSDTWS